MSKAIDNLGRAVDHTLKTSSGAVITKDVLIDLIDADLGSLYNVSQFFTAIGDNAKKLNDWIIKNRKNTALRSMAWFNSICSGLKATAKNNMEGRFLGAFADTVDSLIIILEDLSGNIDKFFTGPNLTIYNTKISQVAIIGMIENAKNFAEFVNLYISMFMADRNPKLDKPEKYVETFMANNLAMACELMNRVINNHLSKSFSSALMKYRNGGSDITVVNSENRTSVQFTKITTEVTESDIQSGAKGFKIFRWIGNLFVDMADKKNRKRVALREQLQARARLLQLELDGVDPESPDYQRLVKIIANYQKQIDRLNQAIAKYEEDN